MTATLDDLCFDALTDATRVPTMHQYLRVSRDRSGREKSQGQQDADNQLHRQRRGWLAGQTYRDTGSASKASRKRRKDYERLVADLQAGDVLQPGDILTMWESSRGTRRQSEWAILLDLLDEAGVYVYVTTHARLYNLQNARDRRTLDEDGTDNAYEAAKTSVR